MAKSKAIGIPVGREPVLVGQVEREQIEPEQSEHRQSARELEREVDRSVSMLGGSMLGGSIVERLAERLGARATAHAVYGDPVARGGLTVIPVARVRMALGGGGGGSHGGDGGGGGGGMLRAEPLGFIELQDGGARFHQIKNPAARLAALPPLILSSGLVAVMVLRGLRRLIRG